MKRFLNTCWLIRNNLNSFGILFSSLILFSCNSSSSKELLNPYHYACNIKGKYGKIENYVIDEKLEKALNQISDFGSKLSEMNRIVFSNSVEDGMNDNWTSEIILYNDLSIIPFKVVYSINKLNEVEVFVKTEEISNKDKDDVRKIISKLKDNEDWKLKIECFSFTYEQEVILYIEDTQKIIFLAELQDCYFSFLPELGITKEVMKLVEILEKI